MRPLLDTVFVSREKLAFIVDATSAPIASISPISSWVGFEVGLIQSELDKIIDIVGEEGLGDIKNTGFGVFLQSIKYR
jgi:Na+/H+ antiporter NhaC